MKTFITLIVCILFSVVFLPCSTEAHYFLEMPKKTIELNDFEICGLDSTPNGDLYVMGYINSCFFVRKYTEEGKHISSYPIFIVNGQLNATNLRIVGQYIHIAGKVFYDVDEYGDYYHQPFQIVLDFEGNIIAKRLLGDKIKTDFDHILLITDIHIDCNGAVLLCVYYLDEEISILKKYDQGQLRVTNLIDGYVTKVTTDNNKIYVAYEKHNAFHYCIHVFYENGLFYKKTMYFKEEFSTIVGLAVDKEGSVYCLIEPHLIYCRVVEEVAECVPIWLYLHKYNKDLEFNWSKDVLSTQNNNSIALFTDILATETDIYIVGTLNVEDFLSGTKMCDFVIAYSKSGERKCDYFGKEENYIYPTQSAIYLQKDVSRLFVDKSIDVLTLLVGITNNDSSQIKKFWVPKIIKAQATFKKGWNMFSVPVYPKLSSEPLLGDNFPNFRVIYGYDPSIGYYRVSSIDPVEPGVGYWGLATTEFTQEYEGIEILGVDLKHRGYWEMRGGCSYPYSYKTRNDELEPSAIFEYIPGVGYDLAQYILESNKAYWVYFSSDILRPMVDIHAFTP